MKKILFFTFTAFLLITAKGQNCTVNSGVDRIVCINSTMTLNGYKNGVFNTGSTWAQIAGPSVTITNPSNPVTNVTGFAVGQSYTFRLSTTCKDGIKVFDDVRMSVVGITIANAGADILACPGASALNGNAPAAGESGQWTTISSNNAGISGVTTTQRNSSFTTSTTAAGSTTMRWRISSSNGCSSQDNVIITNYGGVSPIVTNPKIVITDSCYSVTHCANLRGTYGGNGTAAQIGTWSQLSGPTTASISSSVNNNNVTACNLVQGRYRFRWTVSGPCANGSDTVLVIVPRSTQTISSASAQNIYICNGATSAILIGNTPSFLGETVQWTQIGGPAVSITSPNNASTTVTGLNGTSTYTFRYTIRNAATLCVRNANCFIQYITPPAITFRDTLLPCMVEAFTVPITASGGLNMSYRILSAPAAWGTTPTSYLDITGNANLNVVGLNIPGNYIINVLRSSPSGTGCLNASRSFKVTTSKIVVGANAGTDQFLACNIDSTRVAGNIPDTGFSGTWSTLTGPNQIIYDSVHLFNSYIQGAPVGFLRGSYRLRWTISGGPRCATASDDVVLFFAPTIPNPVNAGTNRSVCYGPTVQLDGTPTIAGETGVWSVTPSAGVVFNNINAPKAIVSGLDSNTVYTFKWKKCNVCGCDSSNVIITTLPTLGPPLANAGLDRCVAAGITSISLSGNNPSPASGKWTKISGPIVSIANDTLYNTTLNGLVDSNYVFEWQTTRGSCEPKRDTMKLTVNCTSPTPNAGVDRDSCGNSFTLNGNTPPYGTATWVQVSGPGGWNINDIHRPNARLTALTAGTYQFAWVFQNGIAPARRDTIRFNIDISPTNPNAGLDQKICNSNGVVILTGNAIANASSTIWSVESPSPNTPNILTPTAQNTTVNGMIAGIYKFRYTVYSQMGICPAKFDEVLDTLIFKANAGRDTGFCDTGVFILRGTSGSTGTWTKLSGGSATIVANGSNTAILSNAGSAGSPYRFLYTIPATFGCPPTIDTMTIVYSDTASNPLAGIDQRLCNATSVTMAANTITAPGSGSWAQLIGPNNSNINTPNSPTTLISNLTSGVYVYTWRATNQFCTIADQVKITIDALPSVANANIDRTICPDTVRMNASTISVGVGNWTQVSGPSVVVFSNASSPKTPISNLTQGIYQFEWRVTNGVCAPNIDVVQINVPNLKPTQAIAGIDSGICNRTATQLNGNQPLIGTGTWSQIGTPASTISTPLSFNSDVTLTSAGIYRYVWTVVNGICKSADTVNYTRSLTPTTANAGVDSTICVYGVFRMYGNAPTIGTGLWQMASGPSPISFVNSSANNSLVNGLTPGVYNLTWTISNGVCPTSSNDVNITVVPAPSIAIAGPPQYLCQPFTTLTGSQDSVGTPLWQRISGPVSANILSPNTPTTVVNSLTNGTYKFRYSIKNGTCTQQDTTTIVFFSPSINDNCSNAKLLVNPNPIGNDSLCAATAQVGEPSTCGFAPCNSLFYKFQTNPSLWYKDITVNFSNIGSCSNGLRVSLFNDGGCPGLGTQHKTCQTISSSGSLSFTDLAPSTVYYMIIDENTAVCSYSKCKYSFQILGQALPVEWNNVNASISNNTNSRITWQTTNEINTKEFILERSLDGMTFTNITSIKSNNSTQMSTYEYIDNVSKLRAGRIYYRIKEIEYNNKINLSKIVSVTKKSSFITNVSISPNPSNGVYNVAMNLEDDADIQVKIVNALGQEIINNANALIKGSNALQLDLSNYAEGIYYINIIGKDSLISEKVVLVK